MDKLSISLRDEQVRRIDELDFKSRSEAIRELVDRGFKYEEIERENERLRNEKQTILNQRNENRELVEYMQRERELQLEDRERRREREQQPVWVRLRRWVFGRQ
jgi:metal-responsive CopG/Arc/MetJ family transcriptional regulator